MFVELFLSAQEEALGLYEKIEIPRVLGRILIDYRCENLPKINGGGAEILDKETGMPRRTETCLVQPRDVLRFPKKTLPLGKGCLLRDLEIPKDLNISTAGLVLDGCKSKALAFAGQDRGVEVFVLNSEVEKITFLGQHPGLVIVAKNTISRLPEVINGRCKLLELTLDEKSHTEDVSLARMIRSFSNPSPKRAIVGFGAT